MVCTPELSPAVSFAALPGALSPSGSASRDKEQASPSSILNFPGAAAGRDTESKEELEMGESKSDGGRLPLPPPPTRPLPLPPPPPAMPVGGVFTHDVGGAPREAPAVGAFFRTAPTTAPSFEANPMAFQTTLQPVHRVKSIRAPLRAGAGGERDLAYTAGSDGRIKVRASRVSKALARRPAGPPPTNRRPPLTNRLVTSSTYPTNLCIPWPTLLPIDRLTDDRRPH